MKLGGEERKEAEGTKTLRQKGGGRLEDGAGLTRPCGHADFRLFPERHGKVLNKGVM